MSKLLLNENPLLVMPELARRIGLNEAIILQQIHYWNEINKKAKNNFKDGYYWTFNSFEKWREQFPFWSIMTLKRSFSKLESYDLIVTGNYNKMKIDRTKWYRINYESLESLANFPCGQYDTPIVTKWYDQSNELVRPLPEINTEINTKIKDNNTSFSSKTMDMFLQSFDSNFKDSIDDALTTYYRYYEHYMGKKHPYLKVDQLERIYDVLETAISEYGDLDSMIEHFFENVKKTDYNVNHFATEGMLNILVERVR